MTTNTTILRRLAGGAIAGLCLLAAVPATAQSADRGREAYVKNGCWQCHGYQGQGGVTGPALAPDTKPLAFYEAFVRNTRGPMPPYSERILSKADMAALHGYLASLPKGPDYRNIPLLNQ